MNYKTNDIYLAGYLQVVGIVMQSNHTEGSKTIFCYEQTDKLKTLVEDYYDMKASINPMHYASALKNLKNCMSSEPFGQKVAFAKRRFELLVVINCTAFVFSESSASAILFV